MARGKPKRDKLVPIDRARLHALILRKGITVAEMARKAGVLPQTLDYLLKGRNKRAREGDRRSLARALGVSIAYLSGDPDAPTPGFDQLHREAYPGSLQPTIHERGATPPLAELEAAALSQVLADLVVDPDKGMPYGEGRLTFLQARAIIMAHLATVLDLGHWRGILRPTLQYAGSNFGDEKEDERDFAAAVSNAIRLLLRSFERGAEPIGRGMRSLLNVLWLTHRQVYAAAKSPEVQQALQIDPTRFDSADVAALRITARLQAAIAMTLHPITLSLPSSDIEDPLFAPGQDPHPEEQSLLRELQRLLGTP